MLRTNSFHAARVWTILSTCTVLLLLAQPATSANISELLEKGIYTEETVGDLDQAIQLYEKVIDEGKDSQNAAAQAQFRIGRCYAKQGKTEKAAAAFQAVVDNYPQATDWVARAKSKLPGDPELLPVPWGDGDELHLEVKLATGKSVGYQIFRIGKLEKEDRALWECSTWQTVTINGQFGKSRVLVDQETFAPIESQWMHTVLGKAEATYHKGQVVIQLTGKDEPTTLKLKDTVYDNEQAAELFRRLPLEVGFKAKVMIISSLGVAKVPITVDVSKIETIEVPVGKFECFRLNLDLGQTFWISNDEHRYLVRFEAGGVTANLTKIRPYKPNQNITLKHTRFSATLPPNWYAYTPSDSDPEKKTQTTLIAPEASVRSRVNAEPVELVKKEHATPREWLERSLSDNPQLLKGYALSDQGIESTTVAGRDAAVAVYEFLNGDKPRKARRILLFGDTSAVDLRFTTATEEFEKWQPAFDKIIASLKVE